ncbi:MAG: hypothetical protein M1825_002702 [Sarcosagium campestre]|nr:MAG: hypothetical protein M1825_002702 [Sarcosagium campestre]
MASPFRDHSTGRPDLAAAIRFIRIAQVFQSCGKLNSYYASPRGSRRTLKPALALEHQQKIFSCRSNTSEFDAPHPYNDGSSSDEQYSRLRSEIDAEIIFSSEAATDCAFSSRPATPAESRLPELNHRQCHARWLLKKLRSFATWGEVLFKREAERHPEAPPPEGAKTTEGAATDKHSLTPPPELLIREAIANLEYRLLVSIGLLEAAFFKIFARIHDNYLWHKAKYLRVLNPEIYFEWPDCKPPLNTRWPWNIKVALVVLWSVYWQNVYPDNQDLYGRRPSYEDLLTRQNLQSAPAQDAFLGQQDALQQNVNGSGLASTRLDISSINLSSSDDIELDIADFVNDPIPYESPRHPLLPQELQRSLSTLVSGQNQAATQIAGLGSQFDYGPGAFMPYLSGAVDPPLNSLSFASDPQIVQTQGQKPNSTSNLAPPSIRIEVPDGHFRLHHDHTPSPTCRSASSAITGFDELSMNAGNLPSPAASTVPGHVPGKSTGPASMEPGDEATPSKPIRTPRPRQPRSRSEENPPRDENGIYCKKCQEAGVRRSFSQKKHVDTHDRPYKCMDSICSNLPGFTYPGGLQRHQKEVHHLHGGPPKALLCPHRSCTRSTGPSFSRKENLNEHLRRRHQPRDAQVTGSALQTQGGRTPPTTAGKRKRGQSVGEDEGDDALSPSNDSPSPMTTTTTQPPSSRTSVYRQRSSITLAATDAAYEYDDDDDEDVDDYDDVCLEVKRLRREMDHAQVQIDYAQTELRELRGDVRWLRAAMRRRVASHGSGSAPNASSLLE